MILYICVHDMSFSHPSSEFLRRISLVHRLLKQRNHLSNLGVAGRQDLAAV